MNTHRRIRPIEMPAGGGNGPAGGAGRDAGGGTRAREHKPKGVSKGAAKYKEEKANKAPSARAQKQINKKAAANDRNEARGTVEALQAKAAWVAEKAKGKGNKFVS